MKENKFCGLDKNGKKIFTDSLILFNSFKNEEFWVSRIERIEFSSNNTLVLCKGWRRNVDEVEVVTKDEAIIAALADGKVMLRFEEDI